jgi:hypothetical protein
VVFRTLGGRLRVPNGESGYLLGELFDCRLVCCDSGLQVTQRGAWKRTSGILVHVEAHDSTGGSRIFGLGLHGYIGSE